jgi:hypothetical protein
MTPSRFGGAIVMDELLRFARKWCLDDYAPQPVDPEHLEVLERELGVSLPADFKKQILSVGLPSPTLALLSGIVDRDVELFDLSSLCEPQDIVGETADWRSAGMPEYLIVIGNDCSGNKFCFDRRDLHAAEVPSAPVYFWDHDTGEVQKLAPSFPLWIASYLENWSDGLTAMDF